VDAAQARGEDYEVLLALDALAVFGALKSDRRRERQSIVQRLGVVRLPVVADFSRRQAGQQAAAELVPAS
jgi:hypothetical protein